MFGLKKCWGTNQRTVDWKILGEQVQFNYNEMAYDGCDDFDPSTFAGKFEEEMPGVIAGLGNVEKHRPNSMAWFQIFAKVFEMRRSSLTKLLAATNNHNGVDILLEYCKHYKENYQELQYFYDSDDFEYSPTILLNNIFRILTESVESMIECRDRVWTALTKNAGYQKMQYQNLSLTYNKIDNFAMVLMADSDLHAAVQALIKSHRNYFRVTRVLIQEPIQDEFWNIIEKYDNGSDMLRDVCVFRNIGEALANLNESIGISVWSENIIAAKNFVNSLQACIVWINAHGEIGAGFCPMLTLLVDSFKKSKIVVDKHSKAHESTVGSIVQTRRSDHFYGGLWQLPSENKYWISNEGVSFAEASRQDFSSCFTAARSADKSWRMTKFSHRAQLLKKFADRLYAKGKSELADTISTFVDLPWIIDGSSLAIVRDGQVEISSTRLPIGNVIIYAPTEPLLFAQLTLSVVTGNTVIVIGSKDFVSFAAYCDILATCSFPPGVINYLSVEKILLDQINEMYYKGLQICASGLLIHSYRDRCPSFVAERESILMDDVEGTMYKAYYYHVTEPKSIWLQCK